MPCFTRTRFNDPMLVGLCQQLNAFDFHLQHQRFNVALNHDIAAATQYEFLLRAQYCIGQQLLHIAVAGNANELMRASRYVKSVVRRKSHIGFKNHAAIFSLSCPNELAEIWLSSQIHAAIRPLPPNVAVSRRCE